MKLTEPQIRRYSRQILLPNVGGRGQKRLLAGELCIYGLGPVGAYCSLYLVAAGVGRLYLSDTARVTIEDVGVAGLYQVEDIGATREEALQKRLTAINPDVTLSVIPGVPVVRQPGHAEVGIQTSRPIVCGSFSRELPHQVGVRAGISSSSRAVLQVGCLACSAPLSDGEGDLHAALALSVGSLAAYEAMRLLLDDEANVGVILSFGSLQTEPKSEKLSCSCKGP